MTVFIGADHGGYEAKNQLKAGLTAAGFEVFDMGADALNLEDDYPVFGRKVAEAVAKAADSRGILLCRSGHGMVITANKIPGVRAILATTDKQTRASRQDDDANVLALGTDYLQTDSILPLVVAWLETAFDGGRHTRRLEEIAALERDYS